MPLLCTQLCTIDCWWLHCHTCPHFCRPLQAACDMDRGSLQGLCQCLLWRQCVPIPQLLPPLSHVGRVIRRNELLLSSKRCGKMSCVYVGRHPVISGRPCWVWEGNTRMFHWQAGDPPPQGSISYALEEVQDERVLDGLLYWYKGVPYV